MRLTLATFNLWGGGEPWRYTAERGIVRGAVPESAATTMQPQEGVWARRRPLIAAALAGADVVGLQELLDEPPMAAELGAAMDCRAATGGGLGVLARFPIERAAYVPLPWPALAEMQQAALLATVLTPGGAIEVVTLHVTPRDEPARLAALEELLRALGERRPLVVGDFNAPPQGATMALMREAGWRDAWATVQSKDPGATMPSHAPVVRIDYVLVPPSATVLAARRIGDRPDRTGFYASDHLGLAVTVEVAPY